MVNISIKELINFIGSRDCVLLSEDTIMDSIYEKVRSDAIKNSALIKFGGNPWKAEKIYLNLNYEVFCISKFLTDTPYYSIERVHHMIGYPELDIG